MSAAFAVSPTVTLHPSRPAISKRPRSSFSTSRPKWTATAQKDPSTQPPPTPAPITSPKPASNNGVPKHAELHSRQNLRKDIYATLSWVGVAAAAAGAIYTSSPTHSLEFVTAYIVEYSLSVDNLFVFLLIFEYFRVPRSSQTRVLNYGILGAVLMRGVMIVAGEALTKKFKAVTVAFAALLLFSAGKLIFTDDEEADDLENNQIVKFSKSLMNFSDRYDGENFFTSINGARIATPMLLVLLCIEFSDVVFALDSVPAVLGISDDTLVIYLSNILAIAGLRNLFFVLSDAIGDLRFLQQSLAIVLAFVGGKMLAGVAGVEVGIVQSLSVIVGTLGTGVGLSLAFPGEDKETPAEG